jgi:hypothetical protein
VQSLAAEHGPPTPHFGQAPPPQSVPVSAPFLTPSVQSAVRHVFPAHDLLVQSLPALQCAPGAQAGHVPPQSTSDSAPFMTLSLQSAAAHLPPVQTASAQSDAMEQALSVLHLGHTAPPQSTSDS